MAFFGIFGKVASNTDHIKWWGSTSTLAPKFTLKNLQCMADNIFQQPNLVIFQRACENRSI